jgi:hypothetical protein
LFPTNFHDGGADFTGTVLLNQIGCSGADFDQMDTNLSKVFEPARCPRTVANDLFMAALFVTPPAGAPPLGAETMAAPLPRDVADYTD